MLQEKYLRIYFILLFAISGIAKGQFIGVDVNVDLRRLSEGDRQLFHTIAEDIEEYFLNTQFAQEAADLEIQIEFRLILESVSYGGSQTIVNAQAICTNISDQYFYAKGVQFPYAKGKKVMHTSSFDPLTTFLDYYAFMFIATELDTWSYMGGTAFYNKAIEISDMGKSSEWSDGWSDRWKKVRNIKKNQYLRGMRFNFFMAMDALRAEEVNVDIIKQSMNAFYEDIKLLDRKLGSNKEALKFLDAYHKEIAELVSVLNMRGCLELLVLYDHDNKKLYESYLKN